MIIRLVLILCLTPILAMADTPVIPIAPKGLTHVKSPVIQWKHIPGVVQYLLHVDQGSAPIHRRWYTATQAKCSTECAITLPFELKPGTYIWMVNYRIGIAGYGKWSEGINFTLRDATKEDKIAACLQQFLNCRSKIEWENFK